MDDTLKNLTLAFFALMVTHKGLEKRVQRDAERQVQEAFQHTGSVRADVEGRGLFGLLASDAWAIDVYGDHLKADRLPFYLYPRPGWKGSIRHLRLHLRDFTLAGLPIVRFEADIPFATYDIGHAIYKDRLVLRGAGTGPSTVTIDREGLQTFILRKYHNTLSDVRVALNTKDSQISLSGHLTVLTGSLPFTATGSVIPRNGRFLDLIDPTILLNGKPLQPQAAANLLKQINPVLDTQEDLGLGGFFTLIDVEIGETLLTIHGRITIAEAK